MRLPVSSVVIARPNGVQAGDCLLAQIAIYDPNGADRPAAPSGWSLVRHDSVSSGNQMTSWVYYKIAGASEPASYSWNITSQYAAGVMGAWRGTLNPPIDNSSGATAKGSGPFSGAAPALTPGNSGELQVYFYGSQAASAPALTLPSALTYRSDAMSSKEGFTLAFGDLAAPSAGIESRRPIRRQNRRGRNDRTGDSPDSGEPLRRNCQRR